MTLIMVTFFLIGLGVGGFWMLLPSVFSDTLDEIAFMTGRHDEAVYAGIRTFFARFALVVQAALYFIIRRLTGFTVTLAPEQITGQMKFGIRFEMLGVAVIFMLAASVLLLAKYDLVGEKLASIRKALDDQAGFISEEEIK
jgi:Na+/melibiose symporter-like transporter